MVPSGRACSHPSNLLRAKRHVSQRIRRDEWQEVVAGDEQAVPGEGNQVAGAVAGPVMNTEGPVARAQAVPVGERRIDQHRLRAAAIVIQAVGERLRFRGVHAMSV